MSLIEVGREMDRLLMEGVAIHPLSPIHKKLQQALQDRDKNHTLSPTEKAEKQKSKAEVLTDESPMPWGMHQGKLLGEVPPEYLVWLYENNKVNGNLKRYIADNLSVLQMQIANQKKGVR